MRAKVRGKRGKRGKKGTARRLAAATTIVAMSLASAGLAAADDTYRPDEAGHPLRIVSYVLWPVGVLIDRLIMRPAYWLGGHEPIRTLVGRDHEHD